MLPDYSPAPPTQDNLPGHISEESSERLPSAGTMRNGYVYPQDTLPPPSVESGYCWLDSPGALSSSTSRSPGQSKLEASLKSKGLLHKGEVLNPAILSEWYSLPPTYLDPLELRTAAQLLEDSEQQREICLTPESLYWSSDGSCICPNCQQLVSVDDSCSACGCEISRSLVLEETQQHSLEKEDSISTDSPIIVLEETQQHSLEKEDSISTDSPIIVLEETQQHSLEKEDSSSTDLPIIVLEETQQHSLEKEDSSSTDLLAIVLEETQPHSLEKEYSSSTDSPKIVLEETQPHSLEKEYSSSTDSPKIVLEETQPHSLEKIFEQKAPQETNSHIQVISSSSGSLYRYLKNVKLKSGEIASYPRVSAVRDPDNLKHWYWGYNYKVLEDGSWKTKSHSVPGVRVVGVRCMIENNAPIAAIRAFIKVLEDDLSNSLEKDVDEIESHSQEKVLGDGSSNSLERPLASGSLYRYLKNKKLKSGAIASYPRVEGVRDLNNPNHWYWGYSYEVLEDREWKGRSLSVKAHKVSAVQAMIDSHKPVSTIKAFIEGQPCIISVGVIKNLSH